MFHLHKVPVVYIRYLREVDISSYRCKKILPLYNSAKIIKKSMNIFRAYDHKCTATFLMVHSVHVVVLPGIVQQLKRATTSFHISSPASDPVPASAPPSDTSHSPKPATFGSSGKSTSEAPGAPPQHPPPSHSPKPVPHVKESTSQMEEGNVSNDFFEVVYFTGYDVIRDLFTPQGEGIHTL